MTLSEELHISTTNEMDMSSPETKKRWDINDNKLPLSEKLDNFDLWPEGHCRRVYPENLEDARRHASGWAMRNTNNHNVAILKKSCLGVLLCSLNCTLPGNSKLSLRPAICDKARKKQCGKPCPNSSCNGFLTLMPCRGHCGYPVTHFWRHTNGCVYFQAKGNHDHPAPDVKPSNEYRRGSRPRELKRTRRLKVEDVPAAVDSVSVDEVDGAPPTKFLRYPTFGEAVCSCPPFECTPFCQKRAPGGTAAHYMTLPGHDLLSQPLQPMSKLSEDLARKAQQHMSAPTAEYFMGSPSGVYNPYTGYPSPLDTFVVDPSSVQMTSTPLMATSSTEHKLSSQSSPDSPHAATPHFVQPDFQLEGAPASTDPFCGFLMSPTSANTVPVTRRPAEPQEQASQLTIESCCTLTDNSPNLLELKPLMSRRVSPENSPQRSAFQPYSSAAPLQVDVASMYPATTTSAMSYTYSPGGSGVTEFNSNLYRPVPVSLHTDYMRYTYGSTGLMFG